MTRERGTRLAIDGGSPVREDLLVFGRPAIGDAEIAEVVDTLRSGWVGTGPKVARFEQSFASRVAAPHAAAVSSGTAALQLAAIAAGLGPGDEVVVPAMTFVASAAAVLHAGAVPVLVDVDPVTQLLDLDAAAAAIGERTRAVLPVHFAGHPAPMAAIERLAHEHDLLVIADAAHCIEGRVDGRGIAEWGDATCFSFYVTKNLTTVEGGMVTSSHRSWIDAVQVAALHGLSKGAWHRYADRGFQHYEVTTLGYKENLTDLQAAIGIHQLAALDANLARRTEIWRRYDDAFGHLPVVLPSLPTGDGDVHARHLYTLRLDLDRLRVDRDTVAAALHAEGIGIGVHYVGVHLQPYYRERFGYRPEQFPVATAISASTLSLPLSPALGDRDVDDVIEATTKVLGAYER